MCMALNPCIEAFVRLFFIAVKFGINNLGWAITALLIFFVYFWLVYHFVTLIAKRFGIKIFVEALAPFIAIILALVIPFIITAWLTGAPVCEAANIISEWLV